MRTDTIVHVVHVHAEGEVGDVVVGGIQPPPGDSLWEQARWVARDGALRAFLLNEPRGGVFRHVNLLVPAKDPSANVGFIIMEPEDNPPMSGSNSICVATVLLEKNIIKSMMPGGSVIGCPKISTLNLLNNQEKESRNIYTGSFGYIKFNGDMRFNIIIRSILNYKNISEISVASGVVIDSNASNEFNENFIKAKALIDLFK